MYATLPFGLHLEIVQVQLHAKRNGINYGAIENILHNTLGTFGTCWECHWKPMGTSWECH